MWVMGANNQTYNYNQFSLYTSSAPSNESSHNSSANIYSIDYIQNLSWEVSESKDRYSQIGSYDYAFEDSYGTPQIKFNFGMIESNGLNLAKLGFFNTTGFIVRDVNNSFDRNFYFLASKNNGNDFNLLSNQDIYDNSTIIAFGNCYPTNLSFSIQARGTLNTSLEYTASYGYTKAFDYTGIAPNVSSSGTRNESTTYSINKTTIDIVNQKSNFDYLSIGRGVNLNFGDASTPSYSNVFIDSLEVNLPIVYEEKQALGERYISSRKPIFPQFGTISIEANCTKDNYSEISGFLSNTFQNLYCDFHITGAPYMIWSFYNAQMENFSTSYGIGDVARFSTQYSFNTRCFHISGSDGLLLGLSKQFLTLFDNNTGDSIGGLNQLDTGAFVYANNIMTF